MQQELRDPEGFQSYQKVHLWLWLIKGIASSYLAVYSLVIGELKSKLKIPIPRSISQKSTAINEFKNIATAKAVRTQDVRHSRLHLASNHTDPEVYEFDF